MHNNSSYCQDSEGIHSLCIMRCVIESCCSTAAALIESRIAVANVASV